MEYRRFGRTNILVSELGLGSAFVSAQGQSIVSDGIRAAIDAGVNFFDTAPYYSAGADEQMLGQALAGVRDRIVLATKVGYTADPNDHRSVAGLTQQFEGSLQRLNVSYVDIIQIHEADFRKWWVDENITPEEGSNPQGALIQDDEIYDFAGAPVIQFVANAIETGKARFVGITAKDARRAARLTRALDVHTIMIAHQFNPILRNASEFLFEEAVAKDVGIMVAAPLMQGLLARPKLKWRGAPPPWMDATFFNAYFGFIDLAEKVGIGVQELTFRWLLREARLHTVLFGFRSVDDIKANVRAVELGPLPEPLQAEIDALGIVHPLIFQGRTTI
ncbi:MAG TPA: aldo/keto reductase [Pseudolabrys sp.]|jgi:aryl-alcohol dehydrogenase-like predicted oxidoreductase|nr:aldo/keto reductase [Pseudolabrys sp.]